MIASLRTFGGPLANAPLWVFSSHPGRLVGLEDHATRLLPLDPPATPCLFGEKVAACASAEALTPTGTRALVWIDPGCLVVQPPLRFTLGDEFDAAFRPVHIRNVGLPASAPLDPFWQGIYTAVGIRDLPSTVTSFVDGQVLRSYFNSHAFAINPALGLLQAWQAHFQLLISNLSFQSTTCADALHQTFLFQTLLSALVAASIAPARLDLLPPVYNYPCHLQERIPDSRRITLLNDLVCFAYEELDLAHLAGFEIHDPLKSWLTRMLPSADRQSGPHDNHPQEQQ